MYTLICRIPFKAALSCAALAWLLAGCASEPTASDSTLAPQPQAASQPAQHTRPAKLRQSASKPASTDQVPSVIIRGKSGPAILANVSQYRTKKGMKVAERDARRLVLSMPLADNAPPAEARMLFTVTPVPGGQRLSGQIFRVTQTPTGPVIRELTAKLRTQLEAELAFYAGH